MKFHYNGNLERDKSYIGLSLKAINQLLAPFKRMSFDVKTKLKLFDSVVALILLYADRSLGNIQI